MKAAPVSGSCQGFSLPHTHPLCSRQASLCQRTPWALVSQADLPYRSLCKRLIQLWSMHAGWFRFVQRSSTVGTEPEGTMSVGRTWEWNLFIFWDLSEIWQDSSLDLSLWMGPCWAHKKTNERYFLSCTQLLASISKLQDIRKPAAQLLTTGLDSPPINPGTSPTLLFIPWVVVVGKLGAAPLPTLHYTVNWARAGLVFISSSLLRTQLIIWLVDASEIVV